MFLSKDQHYNGVNVTIGKFFPDVRIFTHMGSMCMLPYSEVVPNNQQPNPMIDI